MKYQVPQRFYHDHADRAHNPGTVISEKGNLVTVELTPAQAADLLSDALHYNESGTVVYGPEFLGLVSSARFTVARLLDAGVTLDHASTEQPSDRRPKVGDRVIVTGIFGDEIDTIVTDVTPSWAYTECGTGFDLHYGNDWRFAK